MFNFRIVTLEDGTEIVDESQCTYDNTLTPVELVNYIEWERRIYILNRIRQKELIEFERRRRRKRNMCHMLARVCGMM